MNKRNKGEINQANKEKIKPKDTLLLAGFPVRGLFYWKGEV